MTPKATHSIQAGKNDPTRLIEGAPRQPVRKIGAVNGSSLIAFMAGCGGFQACG